MKNSPLEFLVESNKIEGEFSINATVDAIKAWKYAMKNVGDVNIEVIREIHYNLMRRISPQIAGKIRTVRVGIGNEEGIKEECMKPEKIYGALKIWCLDYNKDNDWDTIKKRHIELLRIHPFEDGNGRTGRILMNLQRINAGMEILVIHVGEEQRRYYDWFNQ